MVLTELAPILKIAGFSGDLLPNERLEHHCSLRVGGPAALLAVAGSVEDLRLVMKLCREKGVAVCLLGGGTNTLFGNGGYKGCVVRLGPAFAGIHGPDAGRVEAGAAAGTASLLAFCRHNSLSGLEFLAGIPGTVGGAVRMNAGVPDEDMAGRVMDMDVYTGPADDAVLTLDRSELEFEYRGMKSLGPEEVILSVRLEVSPSTGEDVAAAIEERMVRRARTQPLGLPSAGCWFKNPAGDSAGRLIDAAGLKGLQVGGARVSEVHANFLVNRGGATAADFLALAQRVREVVAERFGVVLEEEVHVY